MSTHSPSPHPSSTEPSSRHASTPVEKQRSQLERLLKDPSKPAYIPAPPKEKTIRPAREMMKNVQGSSAGAGSGEFHVYKAGRRREYERLKAMEDQARKEQEESEFEARKRQREEEADAKTAKNRAKRQKKKERAKGKGPEKDGAEDAGGSAIGPAQATTSGAPLKKRRLVNGKELVFKRPGEESDDDEEVGPEPVSKAEFGPYDSENALAPIAIDVPRIIIHEDG
ncbi:hypothetical protein HETIRDRAFT_123173 [Heterobasidion irregulare TC 32-1]|uniref:DUF1168-domain-containing protein n=1 Tax=Heterobasidion irregulare (strain TC 32-1) TaxID=747525 RepID=W4K5W0_HETIT|nr:uncharacterized protein HETIRDRAFT_123173 [Heterobasidion irregulare TC 32-1]ETW80735.1 hypothetical protein HETIRDRAFT_123173 [Heterobasidion irregulare TC 32-1]